MLRAALWRWKQDLQWATSVASRFGKAFSGILMVLGVFRIAAGDFLGGMWSFVIGLFLFRAAETAYQHVLVSKVLGGERVSRFMTPNPVTLPSDVTLDDAVDRYFYRHHHSFFPVNDDGRLLGCLSTEELKRVPREEWGRRSVASLVVPCGAENAIRSDADALAALAVMRRTGRPRLLVVDDGRLMGLVTLTDLLEFFALKVELEA
jgi:CBS domain-containing protein